MPVIAVCEDDSTLRAAVRRVLESAGHEVRSAATAYELLMVCEKYAPDAIVLDIGLPDADGRDVCLALRARGVDVPVLMLTALDAIHQKAAGFQAGADDYLTKPFDLVELELRMSALLKRTSQVRADGDFTLDPSSFSLSLHGQSVPLTPTEFKLIAELIARPGQVVRRPELVRVAWPLGATVSDNTLDSYVRRLRTKLAELDTEPHIVTVRGVGYRWA